MPIRDIIFTPLKQFDCSFWFYFSEKFDTLVSSCDLDTLYIHHNKNALQTILLAILPTGK